MTKDQEHFLRWRAANPVASPFSDYRKANGKRPRFMGGAFRRMLTRMADCGWLTYRGPLYGITDLGRAMTERRRIQRRRDNRGGDFSQAPSGVNRRGAVHTGYNPYMGRRQGD